MQVNIKIHGTALKPISPRELTVQANQGDTIKDLLAKISSFEPEVSRSITSGRIWREAMIFLNGKNIIYIKGPETPLEDKCTVALTPAAAGG